MRRFTYLALPLVFVACSGANFEATDQAADTSVSFDDSQPADTFVAPPDSGGASPDGAPPADTSVTTPDTMIGTPDGTVGTPDTFVPMLDTATAPELGPVIDTACPPVVDTTTDVYVNAAAPVGGRGTSTCPFRTLAQAALAPKSPTIDRIVHVQAGTYNETATIKIRARESYRGEGGIASKVVFATPPDVCAPAGVTCGFTLDTNSILDGFTIDGGGIAVGIVSVASGGSESRPSIRNTIVKNMARDGIVVYGSGAKLGPNAHASDNGHSGLVVRAGSVSIDGGSNGFDRNKGGIVVDSVYYPGSGIHVYAGSLFVDNYASASNNHIGVAFDGSGASSVQQILSQIDIQGNRTHGVYVGSNWTKILIRETNITKNLQVGVFLNYNETRTNDFDVGTNATTNPGNNVFGGSAVKNGKAGILLCRSGGPNSFFADKNTWTSCPPSQAPHTSCDTAPATYADIVFVNGSGIGGITGPLSAPMSCASM